ncbi:hypothetical protein [Sedimentibacter sp. MB31-C6]|uniref:hypothetical protein n=1 Tax=Sedimentibacter sp. MB31-C6 TaxID=3109366 RepID=UPI002DDDA5BE|nr:hypothetical protein [Sedimentibacter sp. MB36-C1]WSI03236.1 hypothetical protein U8307_09285 [Sedimentibacter sp. MB36-C1]
MECPFCCFLKDYIGQYVRIGVVCNCDTNDHIYIDGYINKRSFNDNTIRLFDSIRGGNVIFTGCCDDIFEIYIFDCGVAGATDTDKVINIETMVKQRQSLFNSVQGILQEEEMSHE